MSSNLDHLFLPREAILEMVPNQLARRLNERYPGGQAYASVVKHLSDDERATIVALYEEIGRLLALTDHQDATVSDDTKQAIEAFARETSLLDVGARVESYSQDALQTREDRLSRFFQELVDGPFLSLCGLMILISRAGIEPEYVQTLFYHCRDHRKIMRSLYETLDPEKRAEDEQIKNHSVDLLIEKWRGATYRAQDAELAIHFQNEFHGDVAERCVEFAEVDRLFYHLVNNAIHYASRPELAIQLVESADQKDLVWLFSNPVSGERLTQLQEMQAESKSVFQFGVGDQRGIGLEALAETVTHAYGLDSSISAETSGYIGAIAENGCFRLWFHWPKVV